MDSLGQRLKELSSGDFEKLCFHLLKERHPTANVRHVEGSCGDLGADTFAGDLADGPVIWQSKAFANGIRESQKEQIRESLRRAVQNLRPRIWILCIPVDMDIHVHKWFQRLTKSYAQKVDMGLMQGSDIVSQLMHRKSIRDYFFPDAALNVNELRALVTKTGEYSDTELAALTQENAQQYIERLKEKDARFNYEIVISTDRKPLSGSQLPGAMFSITSGSTTINVYPRDHEALQLNPPGFDLLFKNTGVSKIEDFVKTGRGQSFGADEVELAHCDLSFPELNAGIGGLRIEPSGPKPSISTRVIFGAGGNRVVYDLVQFVLERAGKEELELASVGTHPFTLKMIIQNTQAICRKMKLRIMEHWPGARFTAVEKYLNALLALREGHEFEIYDLAVC